ncbi:MAG TPA: hypothetical protein VM529_22630 [Gemmata sp.]|nr:hypothetical protein [Gemmata sp.]
MPSLQIVKFQKEHPDGQNRPSYLHHTVGSQSEGFVRGDGLDVGHILLAYSNNGKKAWVGWLTEKFTDADGDGWFFTLLCAKSKADPSQTPEEVTVSVIDPTAPTQQSSPLTASPNPDDVP